MLKFSRNLLSAVALGAATVAAVALPPTYALAQQVSGENVTIVLYGEDGVSKGAYREIAPGQWVEIDAAGQIAGTFKETARSSDSVMLEDAARDIALTLDIANSEITFGAIGDAQDVLYQILSTGADPVGGAAPKAAAATAGPAATGLTVNSIVIGNSGQTAGGYRQTGQTKWAEINADGKVTFKFDEVGRDRGRVLLEDKSRGIALTLDIANNIVTYGGIGSADQVEIYEILSSTARTTTANNVEVNDYIDGLKYDPRLLLREVLDGSSTTVPVKEGRDASSGKVVITTAKKQSFDKEVTSISVLAPISQDIFPGALLVADGRLVDGNPRPSGLARGPLTLSLSLQGSANGTRTVTDPKKSTVKVAVDDMLREWQETGGSNTNADSAVLITKEISDLTQAQAELGFNAKWASGAAEGMLKGSGSSDRTTYIAMYKQIFYTIAVDTPAVPSDFFDPNVTFDKIARDFTNEGPPAYVDSVTYGRLLLVRMEIDNSEVTAEMTGKFEQAIGDDGEASGNAAADLKKVAKSATFSAIALGGKSDQGIFDSKDLSKVQQYIESGSNYSASNPGLPIDYTVKFLKDNTLAKIRLAGEYTTYSSIEYPFGFIKIKHTGGMLGRWKVEWTVPGDDTPGLATNSNWPNGDVAPSFKVVKIPGDARNIRITEELARLINASWQTVVDTVLPDGPNAKCYWMYGTSFFENYVVSDAPGPGDDCTD